MLFCLVCYCTGKWPAPFHLGMISAVKVNALAQFPSQWSQLFFSVSRHFVVLWYLCAWKKAWEWASIGCHLDYLAGVPIKQVGLHIVADSMSNLCIGNSEIPQLQLRYLLSLNHYRVRVWLICTTFKRLILHDMISMRYWHHPWSLLCHTSRSFLAPISNKRAF